MPGGNVRLELSDWVEFERAARTFEAGTRDEDALRSRSRVTVASISRTLLDRFDTASIEVDLLSIRPADLDDVFPSLTGSGTDGGRTPHAMNALVLTGLRDDASPQPSADARRYPSLTPIIAGLPVVFLPPFVYVPGGTLGAGLGRS